MEVLYLLVALGVSPGLCSHVLGTIDGLRYRFNRDCSDDEAEMAAIFVDGLEEDTTGLAQSIVEQVWRIPGCVGAIAYMQFLMVSFLIFYDVGDLNEFPNWDDMSTSIVFLSLLVKTGIVVEQYRPYVISREFLWGLGDVVTRLAETGSVPLIKAYSGIIQDIADKALGCAYSRDSVLPPGLVASLDLMHALHVAILDAQQPESTLVEIAAGIRSFLDSTDDRLEEYADIISAVREIDQSPFATDEAIRDAHFALPAVYFSRVYNVDPGQPA